MQIYKKIAIGVIGLNLVGLLSYMLIVPFSTKADENAITNSETAHFGTINETKDEGNPLKHPPENTKKDYLESYADLMKSYMNLSVDPCDDFYEFACENYQSSAPLNWILWHNKLNVITEHLVNQTEHLLGRMDLAESLNVSNELRVAQRFYNACLEADLDSFPANDPQYLNLIRAIGGFPAVDGANWNASNFSCLEMNAQLINYGAEGLFRNTISDKYPFDSSLNKHTPPWIHEWHTRLYLRSFQMSEKQINELINGMFSFWMDMLSLVQGGIGSCDTSKASDFPKLWWEEKETCDLFIAEVEKVCARHPEEVANYLAILLLEVFSAKDKSQGDYCETTLRTSMAFLFNKLYLAELFTEELIEMEDKIWKSLPSSLEKVDLLRSKFEEWTLPIADRQIPEISHLEIVNDSYAATNINLQRLRVDLRRFSSRHARELYNSSNSQNSLLVQVFDTVQDFQPFAYNQSWPSSLKFGTFALQLVPNITDYWKSEEEFQDRVKCISDYYNKYMDLNGNTTFAKRIDNLVKLRLAFSVYQSHKEDLVEVPEQEEINEQMPGLALLPDQLFFLGFAQNLCFDSKMDHKNEVLEVLMSSEEFFQAYNCPVGSRMRPTDKTCPLW